MNRIWNLDKCGVINDKILTDKGKEAVKKHREDVKESEEWEDKERIKRKTGKRKENR